jgi:hypothetical protein
MPVIWPEPAAFRTVLERMDIRLQHPGLLFQRRPVVVSTLARHSTPYSGLKLRSDWYRSQIQLYAQRGP